jgi:hypothetical protein
LSPQLNSPDSPDSLNSSSSGRSTCCAGVWYYPENELLIIQFQQRGTYQYFNVDPFTAAQLIEAASQGREFNYMIRGRFEYNRIA